MVCHVQCVHPKNVIKTGWEKGDSQIGHTQTDRKGDRVHIDQHNVAKEAGDNFPFM